MPRIMIADDDAAIQLELEEYLTHINYDVVGVADTGLAAVEMARDLKPDLILMDVVMPGELDGISAARKIKGEIDAAVVFITGFDDPEYIERAREVEPFGYVMKPFDENEIRGVIEIVLCRRTLELKLKAAYDRLEQTNLDLQREVAERKKTEKALRASEERFKTIYEQSPIGIQIYNVGGELQHGNKACLDIFGLSEVPEIMGFKLFDDPNISDDHKTRLRKHESIRYEAAFDFEKVKKLNLYKTTKSGIAYLDVQITPLGITEEESIRGYLVQILDITDQKQTAQTLAESELKHKSLYGAMRLMCDNAPDMIWAKDLEGRFLFANKATCRNRLMAKDTDEPIGKTEAYFIDREKQRRPGDPQWHTLGDGHADSEKIVLESKQPGKFDEAGYVKGRFVHLDVLKAPFLDENGGIIGTVGCGRDVTGQKALEAEYDILLARVRKTAESYRDLVENINDVIYSIDENGVITYISPRATPVMGYDLSEFMGKSFTEFMHPDDLPFIQGRFQDIEKGILRPSEYRLRAKTGEYHWVRSSSRPIYVEDRFRGLKGLFIDITEERQLREELLQARKMEAISTLTGGIAHDYNNLLAMIMGNLSMAREETAPHSHLSGFLDEAEQASLKARDLTHELMTLSRGGHPVKKPGSMESLLKDIPQQTQANGVSTIFTIQDNLWLVEYDLRQMQYAISNVLMNAAEAMAQGGIIIIKAENQVIEDKGRDSELPLKKGKYVRLSIKDEGRGISKEHLSQIFDPYFSTKERGVQKGMGLGLTTAYAILRNHGGHITVTSAPGEGTIVNMYLPALECSESPGETGATLHGADAQRDDAQAQSTIANRQSTIQRILVMDDEEMLRTLARRMLERLEYKVETVKDGVEAIEIYKKHLDSGEPFDGVILDLTIKDGMGGEQAIKELLKIDPDVKAIVCSGYFNDPVLAHFEEYGFRGAMAKPYQIADLEHVLKKVLR